MKKYIIKHPRVFSLSAWLSVVIGGILSCVLFICYVYKQEKLFLFFAVLLLLIILAYGMYVLTVIAMYADEKTDEEKNETPEEEDKSFSEILESKKEK